MDDIFSRLLTLTNYITHQFIQFIEDLLFREIRSYSNDSTIVLDSAADYISSQDDSSTFSRYCKLETSICITQNRISDAEDLPVNFELQTLQRNDHSGGINFIFKGLLLPVCCLRLAGRLGLTSLRHIHSFVQCIRAQVLRFISRLRISLRGSSDDIGWLQRDPGMAPVEDGSARFLEILQGIRNGEHMLPDSFVYLLIPGLFSNLAPLYFVSTKRSFSKMGLACHIAKIHSEASVAHNAWELKNYIEELFWGSGKRVMLLGHSKGGVDAAAALSLYQDDLKDKVAGLALVQSPFGGTPIASDVLREGQIADRETRRIMEFLICKLIKGDIRSLEDLTYEKRKEFIKKHKLPNTIPMISFHSEASITPGVIAAMSYIAQAELPRLSLPYFCTSVDDVSKARRQVPVIVPMSAVMALSALHLQLRYGEKSDGLVTRRDAEVPGSVVVKPDKRMDHGWTVYPSWKKKIPTEPDSTDMCEALLTQLVELGYKKNN